MVSTADATGTRTAAARDAATRDAATRDYVDAFAPEEDVARLARRLAAEVGVTPVSAGTGATLRLLATAGSAKSVVEIGTGTGVSALWLLRGIRPDGVLTTIDIEGEYQRMARKVFAEAGHAPGRTRVITGRALDVLPRLADHAYDMLFLDGDRADYAECAAGAGRLLRSGGVLAINGVLAGGRIADPAARDAHTVALRELVRSFREPEDWTTTLAPVGDGLLCAVRR
jgi:predicted O-methyltransferase YrrM